MGEVKKKYDSKLDRLRAELIRAEAFVKSLETRKKNTYEAWLEVEHKRDALHAEELHAVKIWKETK